MATKNNIPSSERISTSFKQLADSAARLNSASDELAKAIAPIDAALKKLNLGVVAWHSYAGNEDQYGDYWSRRVGYAKISGKWGLAISTLSGNVNDFDGDGEEWLFNDAPRWMRVEAVDHIPELLEKLVAAVNKTTADLEKKSGKARDLAKTLSALPAAGVER